MNWGTWRFSVGGVPVGGKQEHGLMNSSGKLLQVSPNVNKNGDPSFLTTFKGFVSIFHHFTVNNL
jgi:hypothetical protein